MEDTLYDHTNAPYPEYHVIDKKTEPEDQLNDIF